MSRNDLFLLFGRIAWSTIHTADFAGYWAMLIKDENCEPGPAGKRPTRKHPERRLLETVNIDLGRRSNFWRYDWSSTSGKTPMRPEWRAYCIADG
jgi:hypothetical protein